MVDDKLELRVGHSGLESHLKSYLAITCVLDSRIAKTERFLPYSYESLNDDWATLST